MTMPTLFEPVVGATSYPYTYQNESEPNSIVLSNRMANTSVQAPKSWIDPGVFHALVLRGTTEYDEIWKNLAQR